jgi:hypothetical protein
MRRPLVDGVDGVLGGAVDGAAGVDLVAGGGADVDDVAAPALDHSGEDGAGGVEEALDVGVHHLVPVARVALLDGFEAAAEAGVVDEDVDLGPVGGEVAEGVGDDAGVADVELDEVGFGTVGLLQLGREGFEPLLTAGGEDEAGAGGGEGARAGRTDARAGSGDEDGAGESTHLQTSGGDEEGMDPAKIAPSRRGASGGGGRGRAAPSSP